MHAVTRIYSGTGARELFDLLERRTSDVESLMRSINGFVSYLLVRTADGGTSVTVYEDKAGADESVRKAKEWVETNASDLGVGPPTIAEGPVILHSTERHLESSMSGPALRV